MKMVKILMSAKLATPAFLKIKIFWNNDHDVIIFVYDVTKKKLSHGSNHIVDVVMWPKFFDSGISMRQVTIITILLEFDQKKAFFEGWSWFKFNNLELALGTTFKFYTSEAKGLKLKLRKFWRLIFTFVEFLFFQKKNCWHSASWVIGINYYRNYEPPKLLLHFIKYRLDQLNNKHAKIAANSIIQSFKSHYQKKKFGVFWPTDHKTFAELNIGHLLIPNTVKLHKSQTTG